MLQEYRPQPWDWEEIVTGCTYPPARLTEPVGGENLSTTILDRVVITIQARDSNVDALVLDSDTTGVTLLNTAAGAWDFTVDEISATDMEDLPAGDYDVTMMIYHDTDKKVCASKGTWKILPE